MNDISDKHHHIHERIRLKMTKNDIFVLRDPRGGCKHAKISTI